LIYDILNDISVAYVTERFSILNGLNHEELEYPNVRSTYTKP